MIVLPSASAGFQSSSLVGVNSLTINSPNTVGAFILKANTPLTIGNIVGANPAWADPFAFSDYVTFWENRNYNFYYLQAIYIDDGLGNYVWFDITTFTDCTNTIVPSNYNTITLQVSSSPKTVPLINGNLGINVIYY